MLKEKIEEDFKKALKGRREIELSALRLLRADILNKEKEKRYGLAKEKSEMNSDELDKESSLGEEEITDLISSKIKKNKQAIAEFEKGEREDLAEKERKEIEVLKKYLPEQLSEQEVRRLAQKAIEAVGAKEIKDMGRVMAELMPKVKGKAEGSLVSDTIKELLG